MSKTRSFASLIAVIASGALLVLPAAAQAPPPEPKPAAPVKPAKPPAPTGTPKVALETTMGKIVVELYPQKAPITVANFLSYVDDRHYDNTIFHRVTPDFMIQGGGFEPGMKQKPTKSPIRNESGNGLSNVRGSIAMARLPDPDSATAQFFINVVDNLSLDRARYCVFGQVVEGMDVVDQIRAARTGRRGGHENVPIDDVAILSIRRAD